MNPGNLRKRFDWKRTAAPLVMAAAVIAAVLTFFPRRPGDVILIVVDTLRADALGCYGGQAVTPRIDALAKAGKRFDPVVGSFHQTSASTGAMFTGLTPSIESRDGGALPWNGRTWCGMSRFGTGEEGSQCLPKSLRTLPERMKAAGYRTVGVSANNLLFRPAGFDRGFDVWKEIGLQGAKPETMPLPEYARRAGESRSAGHVIRAALDALGPSPSTPTFLYLHFMDVHDWWTPGDPAHNDKRIHNYAPAVTRMDTGIGLLLDALDDAGQMRDATVILTSDHGEWLREPHPLPCLPTHGGNPTYESVARVPLIVTPPKGLALDTRSAAFADIALRRTQDIYGLVLAVAGEPDAAPVPVLDRDEVFYSEQMYRTLRRGNWKISCRRGATPPVCVLFDLVTDPHEVVDLSAARPEVVRDLTARMSELAQKTTPPADDGDSGEMTSKDRERLQALGYLQ